MNLSNLLSTKKRERILSEIIFKEEEISVIDIATKLKLSKGFVSKFFALLSKEKAIKRHKNKYFILDNLHVRLLKIIFNLKQFTNFNFKKYSFVLGAGLYGSCVKGENFEDSDIDIWIKVNTSNEKKLAELTGSLKRKFKRISPLYLTKEKIELLKNEDISFYYALALGSLILYGESIV
jgi:predicted nucleotidyltransferase